MDPQKPVAFILPYPIGKAPSQRFRVEQLLPLLDDERIAYRLYPFMDMHTWDVLYKGGSMVQKVIGITKGFLRRWKFVLWCAAKHDIIFIHREASPIGPPVFEWFLTRLWKKKVIYDFDDAIWIPNTSQENKIAAYVKAFWKVPRICSWVDIVTGGNDFLCDYARNNGTPQVVKVPTVVNTDTRYNVLKEHKPGIKPVIGWTGSHSTLKYLDMVVPALQELEKSHEFTFLVIADKQPDIPLKNCHFVPWNEQSEIKDLLKIDIGLMPLTSDKWSEGKCGFKLIQYLALGIPAIASNVGVNSVIIDHNSTGIMCNTDKEWKDGLAKLLDDFSLRSQMGARGRDQIVENFSVAAVRGRFIDLFC